MFSILGLAALAASFTLNAPTGTTGLIMVDKVGGQVRFFDPATDQELASFAPAPEAGSKAHEVAIIDLVSRKMTGSIDIAPHQAPHGIQVDAKGMLYVACDLSRKVLILDPAKRAIVAAIDVEGAGHWLALLPDASKLYVANKNDKPFVSVVDVKSRKMIGRIPTPNGTQGIVASPDGKTVLVADFSQPVLHVISTEKDAVIDSVRVTGVERGLYKVFYSPDGRRVLTALPSGQINLFDAANLHAPQKVVKSAGTALMGFAFAADGRTALVGNHGEGTVTRFDLESGAVLGTFPAGKGVETLAYF
jgi:DNA-binding beta-propeller fold protein YncE